KRREECVDVLMWARCNVNQYRTRSTYTTSTPQHLNTSTHYSCLNVSTGFVAAALRVWVPMVSQAMPTTVTFGRTKIHQARSILFSKFSSQPAMTYRASGIAMAMAIVISTVYSLHS